MIKKWFRQLKKNLGRRKVSSDLYNNLMVGFKSHFGGMYSADLMALGVTKFLVFRQNGKLTVEVTLVRPGMLIGRKGVIINKLIQELTDFVNEPVLINIVESKIWNLK